MFCRKKYCRCSQNYDISIEELKNKVEQGAILLDVRSRQEYREGHLEGAINIPEFEIKNRIEKEIPNKTQMIVVYCQYGGRSRNVCILMKRLGYANIYNLYGGLDIL